MFADFRVHGLKKMGEAPPFSFPTNRCGPVVKALEKVVFNPCTLVRTWGTRPGGKAWWQAGKVVDEMTAQKTTASAVVSHSSKSGLEWGTQPSLPGSKLVKLLFA
jgi:hypothetical protein